MTDLSWRCPCGAFIDVVGHDVAAREEIRSFRANHQLEHFGDDLLEDFR